MTLLPVREASTGSLTCNSCPRSGLHSPFQIMLELLRHLQTTSCIKTDNSCASSNVNDTVKQCQPMPLTCASPGSKIMPQKANFRFTGHVAKTTWLITSPNIIHWHIMQSCYLLNLHGLPELGGCCSKGVMIYLICQHKIILLQHQLVLMNCG
jgi:hypothetical protein